MSSFVLFSILRNLFYLILYLENSEEVVVKNLLLCGRAGSLSHRKIKCVPLHIAERIYCLGWVNFHGLKANRLKHSRYSQEQPVHSP